MPQTVTYDFKRGWQLRCATRNSARERRRLKALAHRRSRHQARQLIASGAEALFVKPMTGWDVI